MNHGPIYLHQQEKRVTVRSGRSAGRTMQPRIARMRPAREEKRHQEG
jgi:hypothetical protein